MTIPGRIGYMLVSYLFSCFYIINVQQTGFQGNFFSGEVKLINLDQNSIKASTKCDIHTHTTDILIIVFGAAQTATHLSKSDLNLTPESGSIHFAKVGFHVTCDCSDYKRAMRFQSESAKNWILDGSLTAALMWVCQNLAARPSLSLYSIVRPPTSFTSPLSPQPSCLHHHLPYRRLLFNHRPFVYLSACSESHPF